LHEDAGRRRGTQQRRSHTVAFAAKHNEKRALQHRNTARLGHIVQGTLLDTFGAFSGGFVLDMEGKREKATVSQTAAFIR
jgi:hypothetical protein